MPTARRPDTSRPIRCSARRRWNSLAAGGAEWTVVKSGRLKQFYSVLENDVPIAKMDLQTLALKRTYPLDIAESVDLPLAMGLVWAINFAHLRRVSGAGAAAG